MTAIAGIFERPERDHRGDLVLRLAEGVEHTEETRRDDAADPAAPALRCGWRPLIAGAAGESRSAEGPNMRDESGRGRWPRS